MRIVGKYVQFGTVACGKKQDILDLIPLTKFSEKLNRLIVREHDLLSYLERKDLMIQCQAVDSHWE
jgi:hypothetical protein